MEQDYFSHLKGNDHIKNYLTRIYENGRVGNSLLFSGPEGIGKFQFALCFAKLLLKTTKEHHADLHIYRPEGKSAMHSIDSMRRFSDDVYLTPYESNRKVFVIEDVDRMLATSANALLKTFEEPSKESVIILVSSKPDMLLPTILSRCQTIRFHQVEELQIKTQSSSHDILIQFLSQGSFTNYTNLMQFSKTLSDDIESQKKELEEQLRQDLVHSFTETVSATQRESIQKEVDGIVSVRLKDQVRELFNIILAWYRDMQLLEVNGDCKHLLLPEYEKEIKKGSLIPLEKLQALIKEAVVSFERSTPLSHCIESLFLQLS